VLYTSKWIRVCCVCVWRCLVLGDVRATNGCYVNWTHRGLRGVVLLPFAIPLCMGVPLFRAPFDVTEDIFNVMPVNIQGPAHQTLQS
jgi:hypothetical protein